MKRKKIFIAVLAAAALVLVPTRNQAQTNIVPEGSWGVFTSSDSDDNINGGSGSWGLFTNSGIGDNGSGNGSWGNFNNEDPYAPLGGGLAWLTVAGIGYACAKRRKAQKHKL